MRTAPFASLRSLFVITDEQAMWRVQTQDDETAFAQLVRRWEGPIQRLCLRMTGDLHRGEDLAQEAFTRVFAKRKEYQPNGKFSTWLWRIALNLCYDELRRRQRREETSLDGMCGEAMAALEAFVAPEPAPDKSLVKQERSELVRKALRGFEVSRDRRRAGRAGRNGEVAHGRGADSNEQDFEADTGSRIS